MNCREVQKRMILWLAGDLNPGEQPELDTHCRACPACSRKRAEVEDSLRWLAGLPDERPELGGAASWSAVRTRIASASKSRRRYPLWVRITVPAASLGVVLLAFFIGRSLFPPPAPSARGGDGSRLILRHMEDVGTAFLEYMNRGDTEADQKVFDFEKQKAHFLLFQNRALRESLKDASSPLVIPLLKDLEVVLYEAANLEPQMPGGHTFIRSLILQKGILFRIRYMEHALAGKATEVST